MDEKRLLNLMMELGVLTRTPRSGPYHVGITNQQTSAAHSYRSSILAYFIAKEEGADENRVLKMCLIHHFPETRLLNQTFVQTRYYSVKDKNKEVIEDQLRGIDGSNELKDLLLEYKERKSREAKIVRDANTLETLVEAKEYMQQGVKIMEIWFSNKREGLHTDTARKLFDVLEKETLFWWKDLR